MRNQRNDENILPEQDISAKNGRSRGEKRFRFPREITAAVVLVLVAVVALKLFPVGTGLKGLPVDQEPQLQTAPATVETLPPTTLPEVIPETTAPEETELPTEPEPVIPADRWKENVLTANPLNALVPKRSQIIEVIFHDELSLAPEGPGRINLAADSSDSVVGWVEQDGRFCILHIAAEGGMSGELCAANMFMNCSSLKSVQFNGAFHTDNATSLRNMFYGCTKLESADVGTFQTSNVTNMEHTFRYCLLLGTPDITGWDFSGVTLYENFLDEEILVNGVHWLVLFE